MDNKIYDYTDLIDKYLSQSFSGSNKDFAEKIKPLLSADSVILAQTNPISGNIKYNTLKAKEWIEWAEKAGASAVIFPELYLLGAPAGDYITKFPIIAQECTEWLDVLAKITPKLKVIIGFAEAKENKYYNSVAVLSNGKIEKIIRKSILNDSSEKDERKYFETFPLNIEERVITVNNKKACIFIGEEYKILESNVDIKKSDFIINCTSSISRAGKEQLLSDKFSNIAKKYTVPLVIVNQVGSSDCLSYEGASRVYDKNGELIYRAKFFEEQFFPVNPFDCNGMLFKQPKGMDVALSNVFNLGYTNDLERTYLSIIQSIRDYFKKTGFKRACLGLSGGLDSTVCAVLLVDALGKENVVGVSMPSKITSVESKSDAKDLAHNLGITFIEAPIKDMFDTTRQTFDNIFSKIGNWQEHRYKESYTNDNIQARARATILWGISNEYEKCIPIATSDKSEAYMGYATINGDMSGGYAPIADVTKTKLFALAKWMNKNREQKNVIPISIINKRPGAELAINQKTGKPLLAEEALMPYEFLDEVIWRIENLSQTIGDMVDAEFLYEKNVKISKEQKLEWLEKFFRRMSYALYKWSITPPFPIVDRHSINSAEYHQSIITSGVNYNRTSIEEKLSSLSKPPLD